MNPEDRRIAPLWFGLLFLVVGLFYGALGMGWIPVSPDRFQDPPWVVALLGFAFALGGGLLLAPSRALRELLTAAFLAAFGAVFLWLGLVSPDRRGPIVGPSIGPFNGDQVGRVLFGSMGLVSLGSAVVVLVNLIQRTLRGS